MLIDQLEESVKYCNRPEKIILDENVFFVLHTERPVSFQEKILNRFGLKFSLQTDEHSALISIDMQALENFRNALKSYMEKSDLKSYIDEIESISLAKFNRISSELNAWLNSEMPAYIEVEMLPNLGEEQYTHLFKNLIDFLKKRGEEVLDSRIRAETASLRAYLKPQTARLIVQGVDSVRQARQAPTIVTEKPQSVEIKETPAPKLPAPDAKTICVLDTGVDRQQPFLRGILLDAVDLTADDSSEDLNGHGTFVAGLAAYGNLENRNDPEASARIISVKVHGRSSNQYPYLEGRLEQAVRRFHEHTKIFSLSVMYPQCCNISQPSDLAYTIDKLSHDYDILFTICSGNVEDELTLLIRSLPYPTYLGDSQCKIYSGAEASTSVTVGGIAHKDSDRSIARVGQPSPFTRRGETGERGKPDVVSSAGNIEQILSTGDLHANNSNLGIVSLGVSPNTLAYDIGTSYAAPIVANTIARLSREYPDAGTNLLKALIVHFASWPDSHFTLNAGEDLKKTLYGKGVPEFERCAYSTNSCPAYILEDSIRYDEVAYIPIYVPQNMRNIYGEKRMRVTLVYDPPVDRGVLGYNLVDLDFQLFKGSRRHQFNIQQKWDHFYRRTWDNVKTDVFRWQKAGWGTEWTLMIFPRVRFRNRIVGSESGEQKFAFVVTLEDPNKRLNIYDAIINERKRLTKPLEAFIQAKRVNTASFNREQNNFKNR
jgi:hypothetical protein